MKTGDRVVCVKSYFDTDKTVKKGTIFILQGVDECGCGDISFNVGLETEYVMTCDKCGDEVSDGIWWLDPKLFAPIVEDEFLNSDEIDKIVEERIDTKIPIEA